MATDLTADPTAGTSGAEDSQGALFCYRHPTRETYIRCGRCERPICTSCAMLGPVGSRCKTCGKPAFDPLTSFTPFQLVAGGGLSIGGGFVGGLLGSSTGGIFGILVGFFVGGLLAEAVMRVVGFKRGPIMIAMVMGGIAIGAVLGLGYTLWPYLSLATAGQPGMEILINMYGTGVLLFAAAAMAGAWTRIR